MEKKPQIIFVLPIIVSLFNVLLFFSMRSMWSGIYSLTKIYLLPPLFLVLLFSLALTSLFLNKKFKKSINIIFLVVNLLFTLLLLGMLLIAFGAWMFILREFLVAGIVLTVMGLLDLLIWKLPIKNQRGILVKKLVIVICNIMFFFFVFDLAPKESSKGPVVFAVGQEYQIVFTTPYDTVSSVNIDGENYYDTYSGSAINSNYHKIVVPMVILDNAGEYTITQQRIFMQGPYYWIKGKIREKTYQFRAPDEKDGVQFYTLSDTHDLFGAAKKAAEWHGDRLDFLIINGDIASFIEREEDLTKAIKLAYEITNGGLPVVYARGNHDSKGVLSDQLHNYVGADGEKFYYTFRLGSVWGVVLDMGGEHDDSWWEYFDSAHYDDYRQQQIQFLRDLQKNSSDEYLNDGVTTRLVISHIPISFYEESEGELLQTKMQMLEELNNMDVDMMLSGHIHKIFWINKNMEQMSTLFDYNDKAMAAYGLSAAFPTFIVSRRSDILSPDKAESEIGSGFIGMATEIIDNELSIWYTNSRKEAIELYDRWTGEIVQQPIMIVND